HIGVRYGIGRTTGATISAHASCPATARTTRAAGAAAAMRGFEDAVAGIAEGRTGIVIDCRDLACGATNRTFTVSPIAAEPGTTALTGIAWRRIRAREAG